MKVTIELEDTHPEDLFIQHMAEQTAHGHVVDWVYGLIYDALHSHPDFRECPDEDCAELIYPTMTVRPVANETWKGYRVSTAPTLLCPRCGKESVRRVPTEPHRSTIESNAKFVTVRHEISPSEPSAAVAARWNREMDLARTPSEPVASRWNQGIDMFPPPPADPVVEKPKGLKGRGASC